MSIDYTSEDARAYNVATSDLGVDLYVTYRQLRINCGKAKCKACRGGGRSHGPYWYAEWKNGNKVRTKYIGKHLPRAIAVFVAHVSSKSWREDQRELAAAALLDIAHHDAAAASESAGVDKTRAEKRSRRTRPRKKRDSYATARAPKARSYATRDRDDACGKVRAVAADGTRLAKQFQIACTLERGHKGPHSAPNQNHIGEWSGNGSSGCVWIPKRDYREWVRRRTKR